MSAPSRKKRVTRTLAELTPGAMGDALAAQGFANGEILLRWPDIAGAELAERSEPIRLQWPRGAKSDKSERDPAVLHVQVESAFALELQMQSQVIIERINRYFGWRCVGSIKPKQGPIGRKKPAPAVLKPLNPEDEARIAKLTSGVEDSRLAEALQRLGRAVTGSQRR
ncbi:DUF721 domain-containing protein [Terrihabitans soli]|nr:DciA family protein [Terrihabitans soli]